MGVLADIYLSTSDKRAIEYDTAPETFVDRAQYREITPFELSTLWALMRGSDWDESAIEDFALLLQEGTGERLIARIPKQMVAALSELSPREVGLLNSKWAETTELNWFPEESRPFLDDLARLARQARKTRSNLYLWNCI